MNVERVILQGLWLSITYLQCTWTLVTFGIEDDAKSI